MTHRFKGDTMKTENLVEEALELLKSGIDDTAIIACSGGIDSTVAAILAHRAVGDLLHCVYVDTGLMRLGESEEVSDMFDEMGIQLKIVDASDRFFDSFRHQVILSRFLLSGRTPGIFQTRETGIIRGLSLKPHLPSNAGAALRMNSGIRFRATG